MITIIRKNINIDPLLLDNNNCLNVNFKIDKNSKIVLSFHHYLDIDDRIKAVEDMASIDYNMFYLYKIKAGEKVSIVAVPIELDL
jgi:hypothetical protein